MPGFDYRSATRAEADRLIEAGWHEVGPAPVPLRGGLNTPLVNPGNWSEYGRRVTLRPFIVARARPKLLWSGPGIP